MHIDAPDRIDMRSDVLPCVGHAFDDQQLGTEIVLGVMIALQSTLRRQEFEFGLLRPWQGREFIATRFRVQTGYEFEVVFAFDAQGQ